MEICWQGFCSGIHSWGITAQNLAKQFIQNHQLDLCSTNGLTFIDSKLHSYLKNNINPNKHYDLKISYTAPHNFKNYLYNGKKRFGIWCSEVNKIANTLIKEHQYLDCLLVPSEWSKQTFITSGWPDAKIKVVHHGYNPEDQDIIPLSIKTNKKYKILVCAGQPHYRKNLKFIIETLFTAFSNKDDVLIIFKIATKKIEHSFEIDFNKILQEAKNKFKSHPEIKIYNQYLDNILPLFKACDILYNASLGEAFNYPALDAIINDKIVIAPKYGGHLDFLNSENSLLIDGKMISAPTFAQYWDPIPEAEYFSPHFEDAVKKLKSSINHFDILTQQIKRNNTWVKENFTWQRQANKILDLAHD